MMIRFALTLTALSLLLVGCGGTDPGSTVAGTYKLVKNQQLLDGVKATAIHDGGAATDAMMEQMKAMVEGMTMTLHVKADGTFAVEGAMGMAFTASGTWVLEEKELVLTATEEDGKPRDEPEISRFVYDGSSLRMPKNDKDQPFDLVLQRE